MFDVEVCWLQAEKAFTDTNENSTAGESKTLAAVLKERYVPRSFVGNILLPKAFNHEQDPIFCNGQIQYRKLL